MVQKGPSWCPTCVSCLCILKIFFQPLQLICCLLQKASCGVVLSCRLKGEVRGAKRPELMSVLCQPCQLAQLCPVLNADMTKFTKVPVYQGTCALHNVQCTMVIFHQRTSATECTRVHQSAPECTRVYQSVPGSGRYQTLPLGSKSSFFLRYRHLLTFSS